MGSNEQEISAIGLHWALLSYFVAHILVSTSGCLSHHEPVPHEHHLGSHKDGDPEKTSITGSSHSAVEDSWTFDSEGEANQTYPSPTMATDSEPDGEKVDLKSCLDVHQLQSIHCLPGSLQFWSQGVLLMEKQGVSGL